MGEQKSRTTGRSSPLFEWSIKINRVVKILGSIEVPDRSTAKRLKLA